MDKLKYVKLENEDGSYSASIPLAVDSDYVDINGKNLTSAMRDKVDVTTMDYIVNDLRTEISSVASCGPAGVYDTKAALIAADPDHSKIYVVVADGHWYYYNNGWQDGGLYQAQVLDDEVQQELEKLKSNFDEYTPALSHSLQILDCISNKVDNYTIIGRSEQDTTSIAGGDSYDSPTPEYAQPINNSTGKITITTSNKNLFYVSTKSYKWITNTSGIIAENSNSYAQIIDLTGINDVYINGDFSLISDNNMRIGLFTEYPVLGLQGVRKLVTASENHHIDTSNYNYMLATVLPLSTPLNVVNNNFYIETSSTHATFTLHDGKIIDFPLSDNQKLMDGDYLADDGIHHVKKQIVLTGSEVWNFRWNEENLHAYCTSIDDIKPVTSTTEDSKVLSNFFPSRTQAETYTTPKYGITRRLNDKQIIIRNDDISTINDFKTWLSTNRPIVEYPLQTEVVEAYTTAQQAVWNEMKKIETYKNYTYIYTASSTGVPPKNKIPYLVNPTVEINNRLEALEEAVFNSSI